MTLLRSVVNRDNEQVIDHITSLQGKDICRCEIVFFASVCASATQLGIRN